jgi:O-antigen/teichoic acid export membrane protein
LRLLTPEGQKTKPRFNLRFLVITVLGLLLLTTLYYWPALTSPNYDAPRSNNLYNNFCEAFTPSYFAYYLHDGTAFDGDLVTAGELVRDFRLPLWYHFENGYPGFPTWYNFNETPPDPAAYKTGSRALLAESTAPVLYPGSALIYLPSDKSFTLFAMAHFWLMGFGLVLLGRRVARRRWWGYLLLLLLLPVGIAQEDWLALLAWLPLALWLLAGRSITGRLLFAPVCGLLLLAMDWPIALLFIGGLLVWALLWEALAGKAGVFRLGRLVGLLVIMVVLGAGMAGPQLFPRLAYSFGPDRSPAYTVPAPNRLVETRPAQNIQIGEFTRPTQSEIEVKLNVPPGTAPFQLVVAERYAGGWTANVFGQQLETDPNKAEHEKQADREREARKGREGKVSATPEGWQTTQVLPVPEGGEYRVLFRYNPMSFTLGLYAAFLSLAGVAVCFVMLGWVRFYREDAASHPVRRVAKNSVTPLFAQLFGKALDFGFALFSLRLLGPEGNGRYTIATTTWLILATLTDFGLETLVTREVASDRSFENSNRHFWTMLFTRFGLAAVAFPVALLWVGAFSLTGNMAQDTAWAIGLFVIGFLPGSISSSMTALFRGYEKYEYLAAIQIMTAIIRVPLGLGALLAGWGVVGLAASSVLVNFISAAALGLLFRREIIKPRLKGAFDFKLARTLLSLSFPLVLNGILTNVLFKSDALLLGALRSDTEVGLYNSAYKFIDAVLIIPSAFTLALFPVLASYANSSRPELKRAFVEGLRLLLIIGLPISAGTAFVAYDLIGALGGAQFLPGGAICLQILIWFLPFSYVNGLTQYVLIALNKQRLITLAVAAATVANVGLNLLLVGQFGYIASSALTIVSELVMLIPFCGIASRELGKIPFWQISWRPVLGAGLMMLGLFGLTAGLGINNFFVTVPVGGLLYLGTLLATRTVTSSDLKMLKKIVARS